jgi:hypothetical protein
MSFVLEWILEASRLLAEAKRDDIAPRKHSDIWHARVDKLLKPIDIPKVNE